MTRVWVVCRCDDNHRWEYLQTSNEEPSEAPCSVDGGPAVLTAELRAGKRPREGGQLQARLVCRRSASAGARGSGPSGCRRRTPEHLGAL